MFLLSFKSFDCKASSFILKLIGLGLFLLQTFNSYKFNCQMCLLLPCPIIKRELFHTELILNSTVNYGKRKHSLR